MQNSQQYSEILPHSASAVPDVRIAAKKWASQNRDIPLKEFEDLVTALIQNQSALSKCMGGILLDYMPSQRGMLDPFLYEKWLEYASGWGEIDAICYGHFTAKEILGNYRTWEQLIKRLSESDNINKRRGAVVLLTKPVKQSPDKRLSELAFLIIDGLKHEKSILITKALSWLLRNMIQFHRRDVEDYLNLNKELIPKIAVRETLNKLKSGRKNGK